MSGVNKATVIGNLGRDPETRLTQSGTPVTSFSVATSSSWRDKQTNEKTERTEWHNVVCWAGLSKIAQQYLHKGSKVYIEGEMRTSSWEKDGVKYYKTEIHAREMQMLDSKGSTSTVVPIKPQTPEEEDFNQDIPF